MIRKIFEAFNRVRNTMNRTNKKSRDPIQFQARALDPTSDSPLSFLRRKKPSRRWKTKGTSQACRTPHPGRCTDEARRIARKERREGKPAPWAKGIKAMVTAKQTRERRRGIGGHRPNQRSRWAAKVKAGTVVDSGRNAIVFKKWFDAVFQGMSNGAGIPIDMLTGEGVTMETCQLLTEHYDL